VPGALRSFVVAVKQRQVGLPKPGNSEGKSAKTVLFQAKIGRVMAFIARTIAPLETEGTENSRQSGHKRPQAATSTGRGLISPLMKRQVEHFVRAGFVCAGQA
jgi:hypothetical protein